MTAGEAQAATLTPVPLDGEALVAISDAILAADPEVEPDIHRAVRTGLGLAAFRIAQPWWPTVDVLWVVIGGGPQAVLRYVAVPAFGGIRVLTGSGEAFGSVARPALRLSGLPDPYSALDYARFYVELTRPMGYRFAVWEGRGDPGLGPERWGLCGRVLRDATVGTDALRRLARWRRASRWEGEGFTALRTILDVLDEPVFAPAGWCTQVLLGAGWTDGQVGRVEALRRLPAGALDPAERDLLASARRVLWPYAENRVLRVLDEDEARSLGAAIGGVFLDERSAGAARCPESGRLSHVTGLEGFVLSLAARPGELEPLDADEDARGEEGFTVMRGGAPEVRRGAASGRFRPTARGPVRFGVGSELYSVAGDGTATLVRRHDGDEWVEADRPAATAADAEVEALEAEWLHEFVSTGWFAPRAAREQPGAGGTGGRPRGQEAGAYRVSLLATVGDAVWLGRLAVWDDGTVSDRWMRVV